MPTLEHRAIQAELTHINNPADLRDALYRFKNKFYTLTIAGRPLRFERRRARAADWRIGFGALLFAALLSLAFAYDPGLIPAFVNSAPWFGLIAVLGCALAAKRRIRLSDWFVLFFLASYVFAALALFPALIFEDAVFASRIFAASLVYSVSLAIFLNISAGIYMLQINLRPRWHEVGA